MLCQLVDMFRERPCTDDFSNWQSIQAYISQNVNKFTQEAIGLKSKLQDKSYSPNTEKIVALYVEYFSNNKYLTYKNHI